MGKRTARNFIRRVFFVALVLRLIPVLLSFNLGIGLDDMFQYDMLARSIVAGNGYRWYAQDDLHLAQQYIQFDLTNVDYDPRGVLTSFRPPLYSAFLALVYFLTGVGPHRFFFARLAQAFLAAVLVPLTYALARHFLPENERAARWAAWTIALYPLLVVYPLSLATENIFFLLVLAAILALLKAAETCRMTYFALAGVLLGLSALTRSVIFVVIGLCVLWVWFALRERKAAVLMFGVVLLIVVPWMTRNSLLNHRLTGIESSLGYSLYMGYHPQGTGTFQYGISLDLIPILDDGVRDRTGLEAAKQFILDEPGRVPYLALRKLEHFFGLERRAVTYFYSNDFFGRAPTTLLLLAAAALLSPFVVVSTSAAFGLALVRGNKKTLLLFLILLGYLAPHVLIQAEERFHLMLVPFFSILAAHFWTSGLVAVKRRWSTPAGRWAVSLAALAVLLLFANWGLELWRDADKISLLFGPNGNQTYFSY